jgi:hypothetical protein
METKIIKHIFFVVIGFAIFEFAVPVFVNILSTGEPMITLGVCGVGDWACTMKYSGCIAIGIFIIGVLFCGIWWLISYIIYITKWKDFITPIQYIDSAGKYYIGAEIENRGNRTLNFYATYREIVLNGKRDSARIFL